jgi:hypothetical protein
MTDNKKTFISSQFGAFKSFEEALSTDEMSEGMDLFRKEAERLENVEAYFKKGNLYEFIDSAKYNADAAEKQIEYRARPTASDGRTQAPSDIEIINPKTGEVLKIIQAKSSENDASWIADEFESPKYEGMDLLTHPAMAEKVQAILKDRGRDEIADRVVSRIDFGGATSGGTEVSEAIFAAEHPEIYSTYLQSVETIEESMVGGGYAAVAGALFTGVICIIDGSTKDIKIAKNKIIKSSKRSAVVGVGGTLLRPGAENLNFDVLSQGNSATALVNCVINTGKTISRFVKGEIDGVQAIEQVGQNGVSTLSSIYTGASTGAAIGAVAGPAGAAAGAMIGTIGGYIVSTAIYQSTIAIAKQADLEEKQFKLMKALYEQSCVELKNYNEKFIEASKSYRKNVSSKVNSVLLNLESGLLTNNIDRVTESLSVLTLLTGQELRYKTLQDFDDAMNSEDPIII